MPLPDQVQLPYTRGYDYGIGVNLSTGGPKNLAVTGAVTGVEGNPGASYGFEVTRIRSTSEIEQALGVSANANYGFASFGAGAEARFNFAKRARVQNSSLVMLVTAYVEMGFKQIDQPDLHPDAQEIQGNAALFAQRYGNMFVRGISGGGFFVAYLRIDTGSAELSQQIAGEVGGSYGLFSAEAQTKFDELTTNYRSETETKAYVEGGPISGIQNLGDPAELLEKMNLFLASFENQPELVTKPYSVTLAPIIIANGPPPPNEVDLQHASDVLTHCGRRRSVLIDKLNTYQYIVDNLSRFDFSNGANFNEISNAAQNAQEDLDLIADCASLAMNSPKDALFPESYADAKGVEYPKTTAPDPLPTPKPIAPIDTVPRLTVPDFLTCGTNRAACKQLASQNGLVVVFDPEMELGLELFMYDPVPAVGTEVAPGSTVLISFALPDFGGH